ncbi:hypothetical protein RB195_018122 [Necator americanus]|uniref:Uncharacterized protein n=1 Tax=Necator americanus TaxID=51031 RepID=A0ABR1C8B0_NECAM
MKTDVNETSNISILGKDFLRSAAFKYLGSTIASGGSHVREITVHVKAVCRTFIQPIAFFGAECRPAKKKKKFQSDGTQSATPDDWYHLSRSQRRYQAGARHGIYSEKEVDADETRLR